MCSMRELTAKQKIMLRIINKCGTFENLATHVEYYVKEFGEESREYFIATLWETYHAISA